MESAYENLHETSRHALLRVHEGTEQPSSEAPRLRYARDSCPTEYMGPCSRASTFDDEAFS